MANVDAEDGMVKNPTLDGHPSLYLDGSKPSGLANHHFWMYNKNLPWFPEVARDG